MIIKESLFRLRKFSTLTFVKTQVTTGIEIKIYRNFTQGLLNGICKIKLGEFIMYRKIISLVLSFTILFFETNGKESAVQQKSGAGQTVSASGDPPGDRTLDPNIKSVVLYQLS